MRNDGTRLYHFASTVETLSITVHTETETLTPNTETSNNIAYNPLEHSRYLKSQNNPNFLHW